MAIMDALDMKKAIRELREKKLSLEKEREDLESELTRLESKERTLRQEYNVVGAINELNVAEKYIVVDGEADKSPSVIR